MKNNTKVRLRLSKQLFESLSKQIIAEVNDGYSVPVKGQSKMPKQSKKASPEVKETNKEAMMEKTSDLEEGLSIFIKKDFNLDGKDFEKGQRISTQPDFDKIEAAGKAGKIKKGEHFKMGVGGGGLKETEKESAKKVMADITALSEEDQAKVKKFIRTHSKKSIKEDEGSSKKYGANSQDTGDTGSSIEFTVTENTPKYFKIDYTITPNSKYRQAGAGSRRPRVPERDTNKIIMKDNIENGWMRVASENFNVGNKFLPQLDQSMPPSEKDNGKRIMP